MRARSLGALVPALLLLALAGRPPRVAASRVVQLTDLNFDRRVNGSHTWLIEAYAPWCSACQQMAPAWEELADRLAGSDILVGQADGTTEKYMLRRFAVQHYPSIYHVTPAGAVRTYEGVRSAAAVSAGGAAGASFLHPGVGGARGPRVPCCGTSSSPRLPVSAAPADGVVCAGGVQVGGGDEHAVRPRQPLRALHGGLLPGPVASQGRLLPAQKGERAVGPGPAVGAAVGAGGARAGPDLGPGLYV